MLKRLFSMLVLGVTVTTFSVQAATVGTLQQAFDELNYSLAVEWDQKDLAFYNEANKKFQNSLHDLKEQGLTNEELVNFAKSQIKDDQARKSYEEALSLVNLNLLSQKELVKTIMKAYGKSFDKGANYLDAGEAVVYGLLILLVVAVVVGASYGAANRPANNTVYCSNRQICNSCYDYYYNYYYYCNCYYVCD